ncbi:nickel pincer cofactor biosynthesis protein LarC [Haloarcula nitratireducens]|uniref:Putative nickel insertion protein n=1 Tax=Haloarcula nitratireducens TaxID=2487749 RepID=A0AAW4PAS3_9EURY|nr:nickel pincer cofactor biosynthesis protein LarC [Halomicroarcula nitratireducens]MBX0294847.1 nickel pincer cofactor biosynthesis protein LarC [Halomicroarcula nitratireducens]
MRTLAFDGRMGAAGDMLLGALLAAGADRAVLSPVEDALDVEYAVSEVDRSGISATRVEVLLTDDDREQHVEHDHSHDEDQRHSHDHDSDHSRSHSHDDGHTHSSDGNSHTHAEGHGPNRSYAEVVDIVEELGLDSGVEADALAIFEILGEAEASVHGTELDETHFHEVGADDAIADVVGAALLLDDLGVERVVTTPLAAGGGTVEMSHGTYPVPTPAVVEIAERADWALRGGPVDAELLTPTGAAVLAHVADGVESLPSLSLDASGYGAGGRSFEGRPNVLRAMVGEGEGRLRRDDITVLETNLDDASPELLGDLQRSLSAVGARDVSVIPATMKKSRPGHLVKVICKPEDAERVARKLAEETGTLGVREHGAGHRWVAERAFETVALAIDGEQYEVAVKLASDGDGEVYDVSAEFDDAAAVADATGLPVREVIRRAERVVRD